MISNVLSKLRTNLFGSGAQRAGSGTSGPTKTDNISLTKTPIGKLDGNPLSFGTYQFPKDVFENQQLGHYMVFYVNQQERQKYNYGSGSKSNIDLTGVDPSLQNALGLNTGLASDRNRLKVKKNTATVENYSKINNENLYAT